jgi:hypothetical protein
LQFVQPLVPWHIHSLHRKQPVEFHNMARLKFHAGIPWRAAPSQKNGQCYRIAIMVFITKGNTSTWNLSTDDTVTTVKLNSLKIYA